MLKKGVKDLLAEANAVVEQISVQDAMKFQFHDEVVFVDVRESQERAQGSIPGSVHVPRGFLEFMADPEGPGHVPALASAERLVVYCGSGGRSALAAKTLKDMGFDNVVNLVGGIQAWAQAGGELDR